MAAGGAEPATGELHVRFDAVPESVPEARLRVRAWCDGAGVAVRTRSNLLLAVTEAASNVVRHAYPDGRAGAFSLDARLDAGEVVVSIRDEGVGPARAARSHAGGLGLEIIARMFPGFTLAEAEPGTQVTIRARSVQA